MHTVGVGILVGISLKFAKKEYHKLEISEKFRCNKEEKIFKIKGECACERDYKSKYFNINTIKSKRE